MNRDFNHKEKAKLIFRLVITTSISSKIWASAKLPKPVGEV